MGRNRSEPCPRCRELEARVAELERRLAPRAGGPCRCRVSRRCGSSSTAGARAGRLRPSPVRRHWMSEQPTAYQCLPMVVANQWGWQVLCPTDVRVTWDGSPEPDGLRVEVDPQ